MRGIEFHGFGTTSATVTTAPETFVAHAMAARASTREFSYRRQQCNDPRSMPSPRAFAHSVFNIPRVTMGLPESAASVSNISGLGDLGRLFCGEVDIVLYSMKAALAEVARLRGADYVDETVDSARAFVQGFDTMFATPIVSSDTCSNIVAQGKAITKQLNEIISASGGNTAPVPNVDVKPSVFSAGNEESPFNFKNWLDALGNVKWIVIGVAGIAGLYYLGPVFKKLVR